MYGRYVKIILTNAKVLKDNSSLMRNKIFGSCITGLLVLLSVILMLSEIIGIKNSYNMKSFATYMNPICFHFCGTIKWICAIINVNEIEELIGRMERCHLSSLKLNENDKDNYYYHLKIMKCKREMSGFSGAYICLLIYGTIQWCLNPIFYDFYNDIYGIKDINSTFSRHLPYPGLIPWKINNIYTYTGTFILQAFASLGSGIGHAIYEVMNIHFLAHACSHLEYLSEIFLDKPNNELIFRSDLAVRKFKNKLRNCVIYHQEILGFLEKLAQTTSTPMFVICSQSTLALCLVSLEASTMKIEVKSFTEKNLDKKKITESYIESIMTVSSLFEYWMGINIQLFLYCYFATKIQRLGLNVADAIYCCDWEQAKALKQIKYNNISDEDKDAIININRIIQFSLMRAQKPIVLYGGLFYILSLETYKALTGFSLSNALILRQVSEG